MDRKNPTAARTLLAKECRPCDGGDCPQIHREGDDVIVQGYTVRETTPDGEQVVRIPRHLLHLAAAMDTEEP